MDLQFFERYLEELNKKGMVDNIIPDEKGNVKICCPFPHYKTKTIVDENWSAKEVEYEYYENVVSSSINLDKRVFHCFACDKAYNELEFAMAITKRSKDDIIKEYDIVNELKNEALNWENNQYKALINNNYILDKLNDLKISKNVIDDLKIGLVLNRVAIPIFHNNSLLNIALYNIDKIENLPKIMYQGGSNVGDIFPFNQWSKNKTSNTVICEGEKDTLVARSFGFNAITLTGGSQAAIKNEYLDYFKNRIVYIVYDNDKSGKTGALKIYKQLKDIANVKITDISEVCINEKEDVADFFIKYKKDKYDFIDLLENNSRIPNNSEFEQIRDKKEFKTTHLIDNIRNNKIKTLLKTNFQVIATSTDIGYGVFENVLFKPFDENEKSLRWFLRDSAENFLELIEGKVKKIDLIPLIARQCGLSEKTWFKNYIAEKSKLITVYKYTVTDEFLGNKDSNKLFDDDYDKRSSDCTIDIYTFERLEMGTYYDIEYKIYPHPKEGQRYIAIAYKIHNFENNIDIKDKNIIKALETFKSNDIVSKIESLYQSARCYIAPYLDKKAWFLMDLVFNSPLDITYKNKIRGALDVFILGDTRSGKSEISTALKILYNFGETIRLKNATTQSLIGGTNMNTKKSKLGVLPRLHKELAILEEFSGCPENFLASITDIRSSNIINLLRVDMELKAPCKLRMITISNPISTHDRQGTVAMFPNGVQPLNELLKAPEDIARYDAMMIIPKIKNLTNIFKAQVNEDLKIPKEYYEIKSRWIRTLKSDNIIINDELGSYIYEKGQELNKLFECSFALFGPETEKKIARFSAALATMLCSTDNFENILITKDHVDYICNFIISLYDNEVFRLKDFADDEKEYNIIKDEDTKILEKIYPQNVIIINFMSHNSRASRNELQTLSGLERHEFSKLINLLASRKFIQLKNDYIIPTIKFRETYRIIDKTINNFDLVGDVM